jgi:hypothetical protein
MNGITNRSQLRHYLEQTMLRTYESLYERGQLEFEKNLVKSYLIEAHPEEADTPASILRFVRALLRGPHTAAEATEDETLIALRGPDGIEGYLDVLDRRFWLLHSTSRADALDQFVERFLVSRPGLDRAWFDGGLLLDLTALGDLRGFGVRFNMPEYGEDLGLSEDEREDFRTFGDAVYIKIRSVRARRFLDELTKQRYFRRTRAIYSIKTKLREEGAGVGGAGALVDFTNAGKATARGTSFDRYQEFLLTARNLYARRIESLEAMRIRYLASDQWDNGFSVAGEPAQIDLSPDVSNFPAFVAQLLNCAHPYRLAGVPHYYSPTYVHIRAVDLHMGQPVGLEVTPSFARVYLPFGSCANILTRLHTNLQSNYAATTEMTPAQA